MSGWQTPSTKFQFLYITGYLEFGSWDLGFFCNHVNPLIKVKNFLAKCFYLSIMRGLLLINPIKTCLKDFSRCFSAYCS